MTRFRNICPAVSSLSHCPVQPVPCPDPVSVSTCQSNLLEDDVEAVLGLDKTDVFDNVVMVEVLEKVDLGL